MTSLIVLCIIAFLIGSVPSGYIVGRMHGVDLRKHGSGNTGATNANRIMGKKAGIITLACDIIKGIIAIWLSAFYFGEPPWDGPRSDVAAVLGLAALLGHCCSPFLKFKGGRGVATGAGVFLILAPVETCIALAVFVFTLRWKRYVSLSSISAAATIPLLLWLSPDPDGRGLAICSTLASAVIVFRHKDNIQRLRAGNEPKTGAKKVD